jgi:hypothetical protein
MMSSEEIQVEKRVAFKGNEGMLSLTASTFRFKPDDSDSEFSESVVEWPVGSITDVHVSPSESSCALVQTRLTFVHDKREQRTVFEFIGDSNESAISGRIRFCSRLDAVRAAAGTLSLQVPASARPSATLSSSQRAELRADFLRDNSDKLMLFKQLVPHLVSETEYWKGAFGSLAFVIRICLCGFLFSFFDFVQRNKRRLMNMPHSVVRALVMSKNRCISKHFIQAFSRRRTGL